MADSESLPTSWHSCMVQGVLFSFDDDVRREIETWVRHGDDGAETLDIITIAGEDVTLVRGFVSCIWSVTPASRAFDREHSKLIAAEVPVADR